MTILSNDDLAKYDDHVAASRRHGHAAMFAGVEDMANLLEEVKASRLKIEQQAETIASLRESLTK